MLYDRPYTNFHESGQYGVFSKETGEIISFIRRLIPAREASFWTCCFSTDQLMNVFRDQKVYKVDFALCNFSFEM